MLTGKVGLSKRQYSYYRAHIRNWKEKGPSYNTGFTQFAVRASYLLIHFCVVLRTTCFLLANQKGLELFIIFIARQTGNEQFNANCVKPETLVSTPLLGGQSNNKVLIHIYNPIQPEILRWRFVVLFISKIGAKRHVTHQSVNKAKRYATKPQSATVKVKQLR